MIGQTTRRGSRRPLPQRLAPARGTRISGQTVFQLQLIAPAVILLVAFELYPIILGLITSFQRYTMYDPSEAFVGFANYKRVLTDEHFYAEVLPNTLLYMVVTVGLELVLGMGLALLLNRRSLDGRVGAVVRMVFILPLMIPIVITGLMFAWLFNDQFGAVNYIIEGLGGPPIAWLTDRWRAFAVVVLAEVWMFTPNFVILLYAGLRSLPTDPHEAARIDGANAWQVFWHITLPLLLPVILIVTIIRLFDAFRAFDIIWTITKGGPGGSTEVFSIYAYKLAFTNLQFDMGAAAAMIGAFVSLVVGVIFYRIFAQITARMVGTL